MPYNSGIGGRNRDSTSRALHTYLLPTPAAAGAAVLAATASAAASTVTTGLSPLDAPRNVVATPAGTAANVLAVSVVVTGTDINNTVITETLPAFTAGALTPAVGVKAFKSVTSVAIPVVGAATTVALGMGSKLGMPVPLARASGILAAYLGGVREATMPTLAPHATDPAQTTVTLASALNGTAVELVYFEP